MEKSKLIKKLILTFLVSLLIIATVLPVISGINLEIIIDKEILSEKQIETSEEILIKCQTYGIPGEPSIEKYIQKGQADILFEKIKNLEYNIVKYPNSDQTIKLQEDIITLAKNLDLLPEDVTLKFPDKILNIIPKNPLLNNKRILPLTNKASEFFCNFASVGKGASTPVIILPRVIPFLLTPIPRLFMRWSAIEGYTSCGGTKSLTGFIANGTHSGYALGFWGIGFSIFLPPLCSYAFFGYALFASVTAEYFEFWPPNNPPKISNINPYDGMINVPISLSELSFKISDLDEEFMNYSVTTSPNIGSGSGNLKSDGIYSIPVSDLEDLTEYIWHVEVDDGKDITCGDYRFTTEANAPIISNPDPYDGQRYVPADISELYFDLKDYQGDPIDFTVETYPDIGSFSGTGVGQGTYSVPVSNLNFTTEYLWFINATDGTFESKKVFSFQTQMEMVFDPFDKGWQYRKCIIINHSMIDGNLEDFPVLISTIDENLSVKAQDDGDDILFMDGIGTANRLIHELELFDSDNGNLVAWVNIPFLNSNVDTVFYMYYGNSDSDNQQIPDLVWDECYKMVHHMKDDPDIYHIKDSTINENNGVKTAGNQPLQINDGNLGYSQHFDGVNDQINVDDFGSIVNTFSIWLKPNVPIDYNQNQMSLIEFTTQQYRLVLGTPYASISIQNVIPPDPRTNVQFCPIDTTWHMIALAWNAEDNHYDIYFDGVSQTVTSINGHVSKMNCNDFKIGGIPTSSYYYKGAIDEIRVSEEIKSPEWIKTEYNNQNDPSSFYFIGPEET